MEPGLRGWHHSQGAELASELNAVLGRLTDALITDSTLGGACVYCRPVTNSMALDFEGQSVGELVVGLKVKHRTPPARRRA